jgi:hypothetical protein
MYGKLPDLFFSLCPSTTVHKLKTGFELNIALSQKVFRQTGLLLYKKASFTEATHFTVTRVG